MRRALTILGLGLALLASNAALAQGLATPSDDKNFVAQSVGEPRGRTLTGIELEERTHSLGLLLHCPVCQGSSISDSPSDTAQNMKREVRDLLAAGFDDEQVKQYFELAYGEFVRLEPKAEGVKLLVWIGPALLLLVGAAVVVGLVRRSGTTGAPADEKVPGRDALPDDPELAPYVLKARELAYGWAGGVPPAQPEVESGR